MCLAIFLTFINNIPSFTLVIIRKKISFRLDPCLLKNCKDHSVCIKRNSQVTVCVCKECFSSDYSPVCASNGRSYASKCHMEMVMCKENIQLDVVKEKPCGKKCARCFQLVTYSVKIY